MGIDARMVVTTAHPVTEEDIRKWSYTLASTLGKDCFWIEKPRRALSLLQEGDYIWDTFQESVYREFPFMPNIIEVNWLQRYYGPDYERGSISVITTTARLLQLMVPDGVVYYWGDTEEYPDKPIDIDALLQHAAKNGTGTYYTHGMPGDPVVICEFCKEPEAPYSWHGGEVSYSCLGCDDTQVRRRS